MYNRLFYFALFSIILTIGIAFHPVEAESMSLSSNNEIYYAGDYIVIFGSVDTIFDDLPVTVQIYHESSLVDVAQVPVAQDGTFVATFSAVGSQWKDEGLYTARGFYTPNIIQEIAFEFYAEIGDKSSSAFPALALNLLENAEIISFNVSLRLKYSFPESNFAKYNLIAPTGFAIDMSLSFKTTIIFVFEIPALFIAS